MHTGSPGRCTAPGTTPIFGFHPSRPLAQVPSVRFYPLAGRALPLQPILGLRIRRCLPLEIRNGVRSATSERLYVILPVAGADAARLSARRAGMLALEFPRHLTGSVFSR
jgi:hypothetical protein